MIRNGKRMGNRGYSRFTGRIRKDETGDHGTNQGQQSGNATGDASSTTQTPAGADNAGTKFDPMAFWNSSDGDKTDSAPSGESTAKDSAPSGQQQQQVPANPAETLAASIQSLKFAPVMNDAAIAELAEGKTDAFHAQLESFGKEVTQASIRNMIPIIAQIRDQLREEFKSEMSGTLKSRDNAADLEAAIPSAKNPAVRPIVDSIFNRAMTVTKGDRKAAIDMTKEMLRLQSTTLGEDIGLPARTAGDNESLVPSKTNWLEELAGR